MSVDIAVSSASRMERHGSLPMDRHDAEALVDAAAAALSIVVAPVHREGVVTALQTLAGLAAEVEAQPLRPEDAKFVAPITAAPASRSGRGASPGAIGGKRHRRLDGRKVGRAPRERPHVIEARGGWATASSARRWPR